MHRVTVASLLAVCCGAFGQAQKGDPPEEITVRAERPLGVMRDELANAEETLYDMFNTVIADPDLEIECKYRKPIASHIRIRVCEPAYVRELRAAGTRRVMRMGTGDGFDLSVMRVTGDATTEISRKDQELLDAMTRAVATNSELMEAYVDYLEKKQALEKALARAELDDGTLP
jgi:hypothetical protein